MNDLDWVPYTRFSIIIILMIKQRLRVINTFFHWLSIVPFFENKVFSPKALKIEAILKARKSRFAKSSDSFRMQI